MKKTSIIHISLLLLLLIGCTTEDAGDDTSEPALLGERNVRVAEAVRKDLYSGMSMTGRIESEVYVNISPAIAARVEKIHVREGDIVKKDDLLLEMDDVNLIQAEQTFRNVERNYRRMAELYRNDVIDRQSYEEIKTSYEIAKRNYEFTHENTVVRSPIEGMVVSINLKEGENYNPMALPFLIRVLSLTDMKAITFLSDRDFVDTDLDMRATVRIDALPEKYLEGYVGFISKEADPTTGSFRCEIIIEEDNDLLRHNQFARIFITTGKAENAVTVPQTAIVNDNIVFTIENGRAFRRTVETGLSSKDEVEIIRGVEEGETVIIMGNIGLTDNYPVNIID